MEQHAIQKLEQIVNKLTDVKEKIALVMDTCCFASIDLDYDELDLMIRDMETAIEELSGVKDNEGRGILEHTPEQMERKK